jgi:hypothetical protein
MRKSLETRSAGETCSCVIRVPHPREWVSASTLHSGTIDESPTQESCIDEKDTVQVEETTDEICDDIMESWNFESLVELLREFVSIVAFSKQSADALPNGKRLLSEETAHAIVAYATRITVEIKLIILELEKTLMSTSSTDDNGSC